MRCVLNTKRFMGKGAIYVAGTIVFSSLTVFAAAQTAPKKHLIGLGSGVRWSEGYGVRASFNLNYEYKFSVKHSIETGLRYLNYPGQTSSFDPGKNRFISTGGSNHYITLPVLYKYSSRIVNIAAGPTLNTLAGRKVADSLIAKEGPYRKQLNEIGIGYQLKVSKTIDLTERLVLEPELSIMGSQYFKKPQPEAGIGFKYRF